MVSLNFIRQIGLPQWAWRYTTLQVRKRVLRSDSRLRLPSGAHVILPRQSQSASEVYVTKGNIDWGAEAVFAAFAAHDRDFLDIGAHIGYYSAYLSPYVRRAYAFEPDPRNIEDLRANALLAGNVEVVDTAVSSRCGSGRLHVGGGSAISSLEGGTAGGETIEVQLTTVDSFVAARPDVQVGLIKTDVEGHDLEALRGMYEVVARHQPLILTECAHHPELEELCRKWNYRIYAFTRDRKTLKTRFQEMTAPDFKEQWYKMLFLVPRRLGAEFAGLVSTNGAGS
ncbi:MAG: FkbM family methyltransferase [Bryobacteraceae bacterium]